MHSINLADIFTPQMEGIKLIFRNGEVVLWESLIT